ncbi:ATP-binding cassette domain-containing protein [Acidithiobacillus caldus]|nr:ATP-binding cassette domain-containing protein [Acidithiobacillus caldus]
MPSNFLEAEGLYKSYSGRPVLQNFGLRIRTGECYVLVGPNGAGKSTCIRGIQGITPLDAGEIRIAGQPVQSLPHGGRYTLGVVPQEDNLDPDFTVAENLWVYGRYFALPRASIRRRTSELLEFMLLADYARKPIAALSGGMKRRLTIARALIHEPRLILLDEPSTGLDPQARHLIWQKLRELKRQGVTLLLTTHYMDEAERLADRVGIIDHGRILDEAPPAELIAHHIPPMVLELRRLDGSRPDPEDWHVGRVAAAERVGDTLLLYGADLAGVHRHFAELGGLQLLLRNANLEDVFLRLTGRDLREGDRE